MRKDIDEIEVEFNFKAKEAYHTFRQHYSSAVLDLNREKDENVFQQTRARYRNALKDELEKIALSIIGRNLEVQEITHLRRNLTNRINDYLQEFALKSQDF